MALTSLPTRAGRRVRPASAPAIEPSGVAAAAVSDWRITLPVLANARVTLRELRMSDAPALAEVLTAEEVTRFISPPPATVEGFERFVQWSTEERAAGQGICYAVVPRGGDAIAGIIQVRQLAQGFDVAEWGFVLARTLWGTGLFHEAAELVLEFAFEVVGVRRLEARAAVVNGRGNGALRRLGAFREGILRQSLSCGGRHLDQALWSILAQEWRARASEGPAPRPRPAVVPVH